MSEFKIQGTITEEDIPPKRVISKYDGLLKALNTLEKEEGIEVDFEDEKKAGSARSMINKRSGRRHYMITGRKRENKYTLYIVRKR